MDKYLIDSHKAIYHPERVARINQYLHSPNDDAISNNYRKMMPLYIEVSPVGACNHRCVFCSVDYIGYKSDFLDPELYKKALVSQAKHSDLPIKAVMFAGEGEPLLHKDISLFLQANSKLHIDSSFTTNAVLLRPDRFDDILPYTSWIKVSCNAGTAATYSRIHRTVPEHFEQVWNNLTRAAEYIRNNNLPTILGVQSLLLPENASEMRTLAKQAKDAGLSYLVIKPYSQHLSSNNEDYAGIDYSSFIEGVEALADLNDDSFNVVFRKNTFATWSSKTHEYCRCMSTPSLWGYIMANGDVYSCSAYLLDDRFKLGSINDSDFFEIWSSDRRMAHAQYVLNELDVSQCRVNCRMNSVNIYLDQIATNSVDHVNFV